MNDNSDRSDLRPRRHGATGHDATRRSFLKTVALVPAALGPAANPGQSTGPTTGTSTTSTEDRARTLRALAPVVLPATSLGERGLEIAVRGFERWLAAFQPVAELDHAYLASDEILYGPPDPRPLFASQLEALGLEANKRFDSDFASLDSGQRERLVRGAIERAANQRVPQALPAPAQAPHVALALLAWFAGTSRANDLCYGRAIGRYECRGLPTGPEEPGLLSANPFADENA